MVRPAQGFQGPNVQAQFAPNVQFTGLEAQARALQGFSDTAFSIAGQFAQVVGREGRRKAAKEGAKVAGEATDAQGNPVYTERPVFTSRDEAFNRAAQSTYALRLQTALQGRLSGILQKHRDNPEEIQSRFSGYVAGLRKSVPQHLQPLLDRQAFALSSPHVSRAYEARRRATIKSNFDVLGEAAKGALRDTQEMGRNIAKGGPLAASAARSLTAQFSTVIAGIDNLVDGVHLTKEQALIQKRQFASQTAMRLLMGQFQGTPRKEQMLKAAASGKLKITVPVIGEDGEVEMKTAPIGKVLDPDAVTQLVGFMRRGIAIQKIGTGIALAGVKGDTERLQKAALDGTEIGDSALFEMIKRARAVGGARGAGLLAAVGNYHYARGLRSLPVADMQAEVNKQAAKVKGLGEGGPAFQVEADRLEIGRKILTNTQSMIARGDGVGAGIKAGVVRDIPVSVSGPIKVMGGDGKERTISAAESLHSRSLVQDALSQHFGKPVSFFRPNEARTIGTIFTSGSIDQRLQVVKNIAAGVPSEKLPGVLAELAKDQPGLATAVGLASIGREDVAGQLVRGRELRNRKLIQVKWKELDVAALPELAKLFPALPGGTLDTTGTAARSMLDSVRDGYAYLSAVAGDQANTELDHDRLDKAIKMVTGGIVERNGGAFIPWQYGLGADAVNARLDRMTKADWEEAGAGSLPVWMRGSQAVPVKVEDLRRHARLASIGPGRYFVMFPNPNGEYFPLIHPGSGKRYVLDMTEVGAVPRPSAPRERIERGRGELETRGLSR